MSDSQSLLRLCQASWMCFKETQLTTNGEFTVPSQSEYEVETHLSLSDIALDDTLSPSLIELTIKQSKTDPFRKGAHLFLAKTGKRVCPVVTLTAFLAI